MFGRFRKKRGGFVTAPAVSRKRFFRKPQISRTKITIVLLSVFGLLMVYVIFFSSLFKLRLVEFEAQGLKCVDKNQIAASLPKKENLLFINVQHVADVLKSKFPCLQTVMVRKKFPESLVVVASERQMAALLVTGIKQPEIKVEVHEASPSSGSATPVPVIPPKDDFKVNESDFTSAFGVDKEGYVITEHPVLDKQIPVFYYLSEEEVAVNHMIPNGIMPKALALSAKMWELGLEVKTQKIIDTSLYIDGPQRIIFLLEKEVSDQVIPLQLILQKAKIDSTPIEKIDLRFDKPVVVYGKKNK